MARGPRPARAVTAGRSGRPPERNHRRVQTHPVFIISPDSAGSSGRASRIASRFRPPGSPAATPPGSLPPQRPLDLSRRGPVAESARTPGVRVGWEKGTAALPREPEGRPRAPWGLARVTGHGAFAFCTQKAQVLAWASGHCRAWMIAFSRPRRPRESLASAQTLLRVPRRFRWPARLPSAASVSQAAQAAQALRAHGWTSPPRPSPCRPATARRILDAAAVGARGLHRPAVQAIAAPSLSAAAAALATGPPEAPVRVAAPLPRRGVLHVDLRGDPGRGPGRDPGREIAEIAKILPRRGVLLAHLHGGVAASRTRTRPAACPPRRADRGRRRRPGSAQMQPADRPPLPDEPQERAAGPSSQGL